MIIKSVLREHYLISKGLIAQLVASERMSEANLLDGVNVKTRLKC